MSMTIRFDAALEFGQFPVRQEFRPTPQIESRLLFLGR